MTSTPGKDVSTKPSCEKIAKSKGCPSPGKDPLKPKLRLQTAMKDNNPLKKIAQLKGGSSIMSQITNAITKSSATKQLAIGSVAGWTTGFLTMKVGRTAAFGIGGSILLFQIAQHKGYVKMDWDKVKEKVDKTSKQISTKYHYVEKSPQWKANITRFARANTCFAAGFVGGFLIGMAS